MMLLLVMFNTAAAIAYFAFGVYALRLNPAASMNRAAAGLLGCFGIWCLGMLGVQSPGLSPAMYRFFGMVAGIGWIWYNSFSLWFTAILCGIGKGIKRRRIALLLFVFPAIFYYQLVTGKLFIAPIEGPWGVAVVWSDSPWVAMWFIYNSAAALAALSLLAWRILHSADRKARRQAQYLFWSTLICQAVGGLSELPAQQGIIPHINHLTTLLWAAALLYVVRRYKLLRLSTVTAAEQIVSAMSDFLFLIDMRGSIVAANKAACKLLGMDAETVRGVKLYDWLYDDASRTVLRAALEQGASACDITLRAQRGAAVAASASIAIIREHDGTPAGAVCVGRDNSERKRYEEQLRQSNEELNSFVRIGSHNLQEPLRNIASFLEMLQARYAEKLDAQAKEYIGYAVDGAVWMKRMIGDLTSYLDISQRPLRMDPVECNGLVRQIVDALRTFIDRTQAQVTLGDLPTVNGDYDLLGRLFMELISNALKFHSPLRAPVIAVSATRSVEPGPNDCWIFAVTDNGIGIEPPYLERIFGIFETLHARSAYPGIGIGLALCRKIAQRHGGKIWAESKPGEGSVFRVQLPIREEAATELVVSAEHSAG